MSWLTGIIGAIGIDAAPATRLSGSGSIDIRGASKASDLPSLRIRVAEYNPRKYGATYSTKAVTGKNLESAGASIGYTGPGGSSGFPTYYLPMPQSVAVTYDPNWTDKSLGPIAGQIYDSANWNVGNAIDGILSGIDNLVSQIDTVSVLGGISPNPNAALNFSGVALREFTFTIRLVPLNAKHAQAIRSTVDDLRKYSLPTSGQSAGLLSRASEAGIDTSAAAQTTNFFYGYPCEFFFDFVTTSSNIPTDELPRSLPCALTRISAAYQGDVDQGPVLHKDGRPAEIVLTLDFKETVSMTREIFNQMYNLGAASGIVDRFGALGASKPPTGAVTNPDTGQVGPFA